MNTHETKSLSASIRSFPAWTIALLLAFAVSVWGLHYKLSLYGAASVNAHGPAAKLLSQKERPVTSAEMEEPPACGNLPASAHHPIAAALLGASLATVSALHVGTQAEKPSQRPASAAAQPSIPRGPPATA